MYYKYTQMSHVFYIESTKKSCNYIAFNGSNEMILLIG
uniref:Uncharacterized protein n=1 Tax=Photobacterium damselae subsp. damselae TaxID=85581 RepID=E4WLI9_PHODD|nr:hypothetical protein [Photobacterium damselae subsp. damselae]